jgi:hypothetical protein
MLPTIGEQDYQPGFFSKIEHLGRFGYGRSERRLPGGDQGIDEYSGYATLSFPSVFTRRERVMPRRTLA